MALDAGVPSRSARVRRQLRDLALLAVPTIVSRAGILTMAVADVIMVGWYSTEELAYMSIGLSIFVPLLVIGIGLMIGVIAITAQTFGAGRESECAGIWYRALPFAGFVGLISAIICSFGEPLLLMFGQTETLAREGGEVARVLAPGLIGYAFYSVSTFFLEGLKRPGPSMIAMLFANVVNIILNWVFIFGNLGAPELGAVGSALTTTVVRASLGLFLVMYILRMKDGERFGLVGCPGRAELSGWWKGSAKARKIGYAGGIGIGSETTAHSILVQFAGLLGVLPVAAYSIAVNIEAVMFMVALGIGSATAVLVGNAWGRGDMSDVRMAAGVGLAMTMIAMGFCAALIAIFREPLASLYSSDAALVEQTVPLLGLVGLVIIADGAQLVVAQSVRALGDTWSAAGRYAAAFLGVMVPLGWMFAIGMEWGARGLLYAMLIGCLVSMTLQGSRFLTLVRRGP